MLSRNADYLQTVPHGFEQYRQFVNFRINGGVKLPCNVNGEIIDAHDPANWMNAADASHSDFGLAFVFTKNDPFFFIDLDHAYSPQSGSWSPLAMELAALFAGAAFEVSQSGTGLHIFGSGAAAIGEAHKKRPRGSGIEFYTSGRFCALTGISKAGSALADFSGVLPAFLSKYGLEQPAEPLLALPVPGVADMPVAEYTGPAEDTRLIEMMLNSRGSSAAIMKDAPHARDLWTGNVQALAARYPAKDRPDGCPFDRSAADAALMQHLAFWTGRHPSRMIRLFMQSALARPEHYSGRFEYRLAKVVDFGITKSNGVYNRPADVPTTSAGDFSQLLDGSALDRLDLPEPVFLVEGLIAPGTIILAAKPKVGKTWFALDLAYAVANGTKFLGRDTRQGDVVHFALEENRRRIKSRMRKIRHMRFGDRPSKQITFATIEDKIAGVDGGFLISLRNLLISNPKIRLITIDTVSTVRSPKKNGEGAYDYDRRSLDPFTHLAAEFPNVTILLIHHTRKTESSDPQEMISGSTGMPAAVDSYFVIGKAPSSKLTILHGRGRDLEEECEYAIQLNSACWDMLGNADEVIMGDTQKAILECLKEAEFPLTQSEIAERIDETRQNVHQRLKTMIGNGIVHRHGKKFTWAGKE